MPADAYDGFTGRFSRPLAPLFADAAAVATGQRALDVGCGPGAPPRRRAAPGRAEALPFDDGVLDRTLAQLVVHFMTDPVTGLREMGRVTRADGVVAACVWDHGGGHGPLSTFWRAAVQVDPSLRDEGHLPGSTDGDLPRLADDAGLRDARQDRIAVTVHFSSFEDWWAPFEHGVGPAGGYVGSLDADHRAAVRERCRTLLGESFDLAAAAWTLTARLH